MLAPLKGKVYIIGYADPEIGITRESLGSRLLEDEFA
jgi:hypothetical protein